MKLTLFGRQMLIGKDITQYTGRTDDLFNVYAQKYGVDYRLRNRLDAYKNVVYACVTLIGESLGDYEPMVQKKNGDQWQTIDHELIGLLRRPGGQDLKAASFSSFDLFEATGSYQLLQGDCFWYMALGKTTGKPREIVVLRPDKVGTSIDRNTGEVEGYFIRRPTGDPIPLEVNEVLRFPFFNPKDPYHGQGVVASGNDYIATDEATAAYTKNFFGNNAGLSGVLNIKGEVTKGAFRKFVRAWRDKYEGVSNAGKVAILRDSDAEFTKVGLGLDELNMAELRKMSLADVAMMFKVPLELLGKITEGAGLGRGNIETLEYVFAKYNIDKKMKRFDSVLMFALERYYGLDNTNYRVVHKSLIPEDKEYELNRLDKLVDRTIKRNEARDEEGLDPVDGGDQLFVPGVNLPLDEAAGGTTTAPASSSSGITVRIRRKVPITGKKKDLAKSKPAGTERFRLSIMRNQAIYERLFRKALKPIFEEQHREALNNIEAHASSLTKDSGKLFDDSDYDAKMVNKLRPILTDLANVQGALALVFAGDTENDFLLTAPVLASIQKSTARMARNFNDETLELLNNTLAEAIQNGESIGEIKGRINDIYGDVNGYRSERIARTETLKASNNASVWAYKQTGYVTGKQWSVNPDACDQCEEFDGKTLPLDESFLEIGQSYTVGEGEDAQTYTNDYDTIEEPPLHPNCRCVIVPVR